MEDKDKLKLNEYKERFIRWQQVTQTQLSYTNNLFLLFSTGLIIFFVNEIGLKIPVNCTLIVATIIGYTLLLSSVLFGLLLTISRLCDFRKTKNIIRLRKNAIETNYKVDDINAEISLLRYDTKKLGRVTWKFLYWQLCTFFLGFVLMTVVAIIKNNI